MKPEQIDHINLVNWFNHTYPELADDFHHFANERRCSVQQGALLKRMGVKKGVPDFFLAVPQTDADLKIRKAGLWLELKVGNNKPTNEQMNFLARKRDSGYQANCVWGFEAAKETIISYLRDHKAIRCKFIPKTLPNSKPIC